MTAPLANAGPDQIFAYNAAPFNAVLDGSGSSDPVDGDAITAYLWTIVGKPAGSAVTIPTPAVVGPTLTGIDLPGTYICHLQVTDAAAESSAAASVPAIFDSLDAAFVYIVHKTQFRDWRIPGKYERQWQDHVNAILTELDSAAFSGVNAAAKFLLEGSDASMVNAIDVLSIAANLIFASANDAVTPLGVKRFSATATADIFAALDHTGGALVGVQAGGDLDLKADLRLLTWTNVSIRQNGTAIEFRTVGAPATMASITSTGDGLFNGRSITINNDAAGGTPEDTTLEMRGGDGAAIVATFDQLTPATKRQATWMEVGGVIPTAWDFMVGKPGSTTASDPQLTISGGDGANVFDLRIAIVAAGSKARITSPGGFVTQLELEDRMILDVDADVQVMDGIDFDQPNAGSAAYAKRTTAGDLVIGTDHGATGGDLIFRTKGADAWKVANTTGYLESTGGNKLIRGVLDPTAVQDAATKFFVEPQVVLKNTDDTGYVADNREYVHVDCNAGGAAPGAVTINLPAPVTGMRVHVMKLDATGQIVTVAGNGGPLINGTATHDLGAQWDAVTVYSNGTNWFIE